MRSRERPYTATGTVIDETFRNFKPMELVAYQRFDVGECLASAYQFRGCVDVAKMNSSEKALTLTICDCIPVQEGVVLS